MAPVLQRSAPMNIAPSDRIRASLAVALLAFAAAAPACASRPDASEVLGQYASPLDAYEPQSCTDYATQCGVVNTLSVAADVVGQIRPGCDVFDGIAILGEACSASELSAGENAAIWACNVLACVPACNTLPHIIAARAACAGGNVAATMIRCATLSALCEHERENARPVCRTDTCPYRPSTGACDPGGFRSEGDVTRECIDIVGSYGVSGSTSSSCISKCIRTTLDARSDCWNPPPMCVSELGGGATQ